MRTRSLSLRAGAAALIAGALVIGGAAAAHADTVIDTTAGAATDFESFGAPGVTTETYGQTILVPAGESALTEFSFQMRGENDLVFRGQVYAWDDATLLPAGPALYTSGPRTLTTPSADFETVVFDTGGVPVTAGQRYVLLATTLLDVQTTTTEFIWNATDPAAYSGGYAMYSNQDTLAGMLADWDGARSPYMDADFALTADFSSAPAITALAPATGSAAGGTSVVLTGTSLSSVTAVFFGTTPATSFTVDSATQITAVAPAGTLGEVAVTAVSPAGRSAASPASTFSYTAAALAAPTLAATGSSADVIAPIGAVVLGLGVMLLAFRRPAMSLLTRR